MKTDGTREPSVAIAASPKAHRRFMLLRELIKNLLSCGPFSYGHGTDAADSAPASLTRICQQDPFGEVMTTLFGCATKMSPPWTCSFVCGLLFPMPTLPASLTMNLPPVVPAASTWKSP